MASEYCAGCGRLLGSDEEFCVQCGRRRLRVASADPVAVSTAPVVVNVKRKKSSNTVAIVLGTITICVVCLVMGDKLLDAYFRVTTPNTSETATPRPTPTPINLEELYPDAADLEKQVAKLKKMNFIYSFEPTLSTVYVNRRMWDNSAIDVKEAAASTLARYCGLKKGNGINRIEIYDSHSGRRIAKFGSWGLKIEEN